MVSYDANRLTIINTLYCIMVCEIKAIYDKKSRANSFQDPVETSFLETLLRWFKVWHKSDMQS